MTSTVKPTDANGRSTSRSFDLDGPGSGATKSRIPEVALGALVLVVSALAALWLFTSSSERTSVLALANPVERGEVLDIDDLVSVEVASDDALVVLRPEQSVDMVGRVALTDLPAGVLLTPSQFAVASPLASGEGIVGLDLESGQVPSSRLTPGTTVSVILTPTPSDPSAGDLSDGGAAALGEVLVDAAVVVETQQSAGQGSVYVALSMSEVDARAVSVAATLGQVRLVQVKR
ncbi:MAG: SAF domain-containing protein [Acidimicrobiales bacterium]|nr:SAF domain-containing protein [Acidimicrobiales bacterium]